MSEYSKLSDAQLLGQIRAALIELERRAQERDERDKRYHAALRKAGLHIRVEP